MEVQVTTDHSLYSGITHSYSTELAGCQKPVQTSQAGYVSDQLREPNGSFSFSLTPFSVFLVLYWSEQACMFCVSPNFLANYYSAH